MANGFAWRGAICAAMTAATPHAASGQSSPSPPPVERPRAHSQHYVTPDGAGFVFQRDGAQALLRFDGDAEILALAAAPGPRGDELYKTDTGAIMVRVTALGGIIVFRDGDLGAPASSDASAAPIEPPAYVPPKLLRAQLATLARRYAAARGRTIRIQAPAEGGGLAVDAAELALKALDRAERDIEIVEITIAARPDVELAAGGVLRIMIAPELGYAGRPSSAAIAQVLAQP